jgi:hypothetical protein
MLKKQLKKYIANYTTRKKMLPFEQVLYQIVNRKSMFDLSIKLEDTPFGGVVLLSGTKDIIS